MIYRAVILFLLGIFIFGITGCHAAQEKAWRESLDVARQKIAEDEKLSQHIDRIEMERRQFLRVYIKSQVSKLNYAKLTAQVAQIFGDAFFAHPGNKMKELIIFGNLVDGDELIVCKYANGQVVIDKDRTMLSM